MKNSRIFLLSIALIFGFMAQAKKLGMEISYAHFQNAKSQGYVELYFALGGQTIDYKTTPSGKYTGGVEITVAVMQDSNIVSADKIRIMSPELEDSAHVSDVFINQIRFALPNGQYRFDIDITDVNDPSESYHLQQAFAMNVKADESHFSDLLFLDSYQPAASNNIFAKSGYELVPMVSSGSYYFPEGIDKISFYVELYNADKAAGKGEPYIIKYYLRDANTQEALTGFSSFIRKNAEAVQPVLSSFSIDKLRTGNYELVFEALDKEGKPFASRSQFFYRKNAGPTVTINDLTNADVSGTFVQRLGGLDSLYLFTKYLYPISSDAEQRYQKELLETRDLSKLKTYFYVFWQQKNPQNPEAAWKQYHQNVKIVNDLYTTSLQPGYRSDRGRVYLQYGKPDLVESRKFEPAMPPYEIWQYNQINTPYAVKQTNKMFVFAEFDKSTNDYELFHSTAVGELSSRRWRYDMQLKASGAGGDIDDDADASQRDPFGSRANDNIIMDGTGSDRQNR